MADPGPGQGGTTGEKGGAGKDVRVHVGGVDVKHTDVQDVETMTQAGNKRGKYQGFDADHVGVKT